MNRYIYSILVIFLCLLASVVVRAERPLIDNENVVAGYRKLPLSFEANQGQTDKQVKFLSCGRGCTLCLPATVPGTWLGG